MILLLVYLIQAEQVYGKLDDSVNDFPLVKNVRKNANIIDIIPSQKNFG